jgi:subtilase family serine protease
MLSRISLSAIAATLALTVSAMAEERTDAPFLAGTGIDDGQRIVLAGNTRPELSRANDRGPVSANFQMEHMLLQLKRPPALEKAADAELARLNDPTSPDYQHWLTAKEFGAKFGLRAADLEKIKEWLRNHGFRVNKVYANGLLIDFSGTAALVSSAFNTEIHAFDVDGERHTANVSDPQIPAALAPAVAGIVSLHDFRPRNASRPIADYTINDGYAQIVAPGDIATIYNLNPLFAQGITGTGQTIVVIEDTDVYDTADWSQFRATFGLDNYSGGSFTELHPGANCGAPGVLVGNDFEAILDAEWASAAAPDAAIVLASCADTNSTFGGLIAFDNMIESDNPPKIFSISYGACEAFNGAAGNAAYYYAYQQAAAEGISVFVASGDWGAAICDANNGNTTAAELGVSTNGLASTPYNVAVGGTDFEDTYFHANGLYWNRTNDKYFASAKSYVPEMSWNDSCASELLAEYVMRSKSAATYGSNGFCNSTFGEMLRTTTSGSGGPSGCAKGKPAEPGIVSGTCAGYAKPSWQAMPGNPDDAVRDLPDVSLFAADGLWGHYYVVCYSDEKGGGAKCNGAPSNWSGGGGTSFASPIMAAIQALVNQKTGAAQGNPAPIYYQLARGEFGPSGHTRCVRPYHEKSCVFHNVVDGNIDVDCVGTVDCLLPSGAAGVLAISPNADYRTDVNADYAIAYPAGLGWNFATGLGSVNAANLVENWPLAKKTTEFTHF